MLAAQENMPRGGNMVVMDCRVCGDPATAYGRCDTCYRYWRRTGRDRTEAMIVRAGSRAVHRNGPDAGLVARELQRRFRQNVQSLA